jgi:hypothetical protein
MGGGAVEIALDVGGQEIKMCCREVAAASVLTRLTSIPSRSKGLFTKRSNNRQAMETLCAVLQEQMSTHSMALNQVTKVAVAFAGPVDLDSGHILKAYNLGGKSHHGDLAGPLWDHLTGRYNAPRSLRVHVLNDALAPALAVLCAFEYTCIWPELSAALPYQAKLPALCLSLGTSVGVSVIAAPSTASEERGLITLPETWVCATLPTATGPTCLWEFLGSKANSVDPEGIGMRIHAALPKFLELWDSEASLMEPAYTVIFTGGFAHALKHLDGSTWVNPQNPAQSIVLAVPADTSALALHGAFNFRAAPMVCRVRRVAVIEGLEMSNSEVVVCA